MSGKAIAIRYTGTSKCRQACLDLDTEGVLQERIDGSSGSEIKILEIDIPHITGWTKVPVGHYILRSKSERITMITPQQYENLNRKGMVN